MDYNKLLIESSLRVANEVSARLRAGKRPTISGVEDLRNHVRKLVAALEAVHEAALASLAQGGDGGEK